MGSLDGAQPPVDIDRAIALVRKGQQLAGHFPSETALDRARRVLSGELSPADAEAEMQIALQRIVDDETEAR